MQQFNPGAAMGFDPADRTETINVPTARALRPSQPNDTAVSAISDLTRPTIEGPEHVQAGHPCNRPSGLTLSSAHLRFEDSLKLGGQTKRISRFAFPNDQHSPSGLSQKSTLATITKNVCQELPPPELGARSRHRRELAAGMAMPETAVHENHCAPARKHYVGAARQRMI